MVLGIAGCGGNSGNASGTDKENPVDKNSLIIAMGNTSEPEAGFDPAYGWGAGEHVHEPLIQSTLTVTTPDLEIGYDLATSITVSDDGMLWTVTIRDDAYFTDGEKLTAEDVAFTYNTVKEKSTLNDFTMLDRAEAADETTVLFHMTRPYSIFPYSMAIVGIVPEHAYDENYGLNPIGSGRYMMVQWDKGQQVIFKANPDYYGEAPKIENVTVVFMSEDAAFAAAKAGQVDVAYTAASYSEQTINGYNLFAVDSVDNRGINLPVVDYDGFYGNDATADIALRQAINIGIDRESLIENVLNGYGTPAYSVCDNLPWYYEGNEVSYDFDEAVKILENSGWTAGEDGIREKNGVRASFTLLYPSNSSDRQAIAAELSNQLKALGIEATCEGVGWDTAYDRAQSTPLVWGWGAHTPMEIYNIYHSVNSNEFAAYSPYTNAAADTLMDQALASTDLNESYTLWQDAQEIIAEDCPWIWLLNVDHLYWVRNGLKISEQKIHPHGHGWSIVNNVDKWSWE